MGEIEWDKLKARLHNISCKLKNSLTMDIELDEIKKWKALRPKLILTYDFNNDWQDAITLFSNRLEVKFFNPMDNLINNGLLKGEGFTILTVQCALIESLASFRTGQIFNHKANNSIPKYEYRESGKMFVDFLHSAAIFEDNFFTKNNNVIKKNDPFDAELFYQEVRCGLMHEAKTKGKWIINANRNHDVKSKIFLVERSGKTSILRTVLHYKLKQYVVDYCNELKQDNSNELRRLFARKLDFLFETIGDKNNYEWWNE